MRFPSLRAVLLLCIMLPAGSAFAQNGPEPLASLLASIRVLKLECSIKPAPNRLTTLVAHSGYRLDEFLPRGRYFGLVQARLAEMRPPSRSERPSFCANLAERVRTSPLNNPPSGSAAAPERPRRGGAVNLNTASVDELNSLGAGMVGRTIIYGRPYRSPEDLLERRLLTYRDFARIRDRVTAR